VAEGDWDKVIEAGMDYADLRCDEYIHALFRLNRDRKTSTAQLGLLGAASAGLMAAAEASARNVAAVAIAFGLASATVDNCCVPCDHVPVRSWPLFRAREVMPALIESFRKGQKT